MLWTVVLLLILCPPSIPPSLCFQGPVWHQTKYQVCTGDSIQYKYTSSSVRRLPAARTAGLHFKNFNRSTSTLSRQASGRRRTRRRSQAFGPWSCGWCRCTCPEREKEREINARTDRANKFGAPIGPKLKKKNAKKFGSEKKLSKMPNFVRIFFSVARNKKANETGERIPLRANRCQTLKFEEGLLGNLNFKIYFFRIQNSTEQELMIFLIF